MLIELTHCVVMLTLCLFNVVMKEYFSYSLLHPCNNLCYSGVAASEGAHVLKVHASLIEIHIQVTNHHVMGHFSLS